MYFADANTGNTILQIPLVDFDISREVWNANQKGIHVSQLPLMSTKIADENSIFNNPITDNDAQAIWNKLQTVYDYFNNNFAWKSYDNKDSLIKAYVHANTSCP